VNARCLDGVDGPSLKPPWPSGYLDKAFAAYQKDHRQTMVAYENQ
jgi:hypothetical protein